MRKRLIAIPATAALALTALSSPAWAAGPIDSGQGIAVTITNPAAATVTLGASTLALDATKNTDVTNAGPTPLGAALDPANSSFADGTGGIFVRVTSNNGTGYVLDIDGPSGGFTSPTQAAMPNADMHVGAITGVSANGTPKAIVSQGTLDTNQQVLANSGVSGSVWDDSSNLASDRVAGQDETRVALWVNPNVLVGGATYQGTTELFYIPNL